MRLGALEAEAGSADVLIDAAVASTPDELTVATRPAVGQLGSLQTDCYRGPRPGRSVP